MTTKKAISQKTCTIGICWQLMIKNNLIFRCVHCIGKKVCSPNELMRMHNIRYQVWPYTKWWCECLCLVSKMIALLCLFLLLLFHFLWSDNSVSISDVKTMRDAFSFWAHKTSERITVEWHKNTATQFNWMELNEMRPTMDFLENEAAKRRQNIQYSIRNV